MTFDYDRMDPAIVHRILKGERGDLRELMRLLYALLRDAATAG